MAMRDNRATPGLTVEMRMTWRGNDGASADVSAREVESLKDHAEMSVEITKRLHRLCRLLKGYAKTGRRIDPTQLFALLDVMDEEFDQLGDVQGGVASQIALAEPLSLLPQAPDPSSDRRPLRVVSHPA